MPRNKFCNFFGGRPPSAIVPGPPTGWEFALCARDIASHSDLSWADLNFDICGVVGSQPPKVNQIFLKIFSQIFETFSLKNHNPAKLGSHAAM